MNRYQGLHGVFLALLAFLVVLSQVLLADNYKAKRAMIITYSISILSIATVVFVHNAVAALFACAIFGLAYNGIFGLQSPTYVTRVLPPEKTAKLFGLLNLSLGVGSMIGNYAGGYMKKTTGSFSLALSINACDVHTNCFDLYIHKIRSKRRGGYLIWKESC